jgi:hypothetical protein
MKTGKANIFTELATAVILAMGSPYHQMDLCQIFGRIAIIPL